MTIFKEKLALEDLYQHNGGAHWNRKNHWMGNKSPCSYYEPWYGIQCKNNSVNHLVLRGNNLQNDIQFNISYLPNLEMVDFTENYLVGTIPTAFGELENLQLLRLGSNNFTGEIPEELANLHKAILIDLSTNHLEGEIPSNLLDLFPTLQWLNLADNKLEGCFPPKIEHLNSTQISLGFNAFRFDFFFSKS